MLVVVFFCHCWQFFADDGATLYGFRLKKKKNWQAITPSFLLGSLLHKALTTGKGASAE